MVAPDRFRFLNTERCCATAADWRTETASRLWRYHLHYFDDLNAENAETRAQWHRDLIERWIAENPPGKGDGWDPYPTSLRIVNWSKWLLVGNDPTPDMLASLATQVRWLAQRIEHHILGNHLFTNAKALMFGGLLFEGRDAESWYAQGAKICSQQLESQVLPDGGHFELSPMYHALFLEDLLDLLNLHHAFGNQAPARWPDDVDSMFSWLRVMTHPDGEIAFFNDAALGNAPSLFELNAYARRLDVSAGGPPGQEPSFLEQSGYVRAVAGAAHLFCDCAAIGPDYLPAHGHADALSFEMSLGAERVFVNSGTSLYGSSEERLRQRGTAAHNTVVVDEMDSSEVWAGFRVARRAVVSVERIELSVPTLVAASHDGYRRLRGDVVHSRQWSLQSTRLRIDDSLHGKFDSAFARFHLHPDIVAITKEGKIELRLPSGTRMLMGFDNAGEVEVADSTWHPYFGVSVRNQCIQVRLIGESLTTDVSWAH